MKKTSLPVIFALLISLLALQGIQVWAFANVNAAAANVSTADETVSTVFLSTTHMSVYVVFPTSAYPGQTETILATTTATSSGTIVSFSMDVFALIDGQLMKIASQTILANAYVTVGEEWRSVVVVAIPADAQSASLSGTITEVWQQVPNYYSPYYVMPYYDTPYYTRNYQYYNYNAQQRIRLPLRQAPAPETLRLLNGVVVPVTVRLPNGVVVSKTSPQTSIVLNPQLSLPSGNTALQKPPRTQPSYVARPAPYYVPNYVPDYPPNYVPNYSSYPTLLTSQRTFALTYILE